MVSIYILIAAMAFLVIIASINFINLSTARAFERAKEVGVRKTLGADNLGVSLQFMTEAVVTSLFSLLFAYLIALLVFGEFVNLLGQPLSITELYNPSVIFTFIGMAMLVGLITGLYPAIAVTKIHPDLILKGKFVNQSKGIMLRKSLILVQFVVSAVMIFGSLTVMRQVNFMAEKELGFDATEILVMKFHNNNELRKLPAIKNELMKITGVVSVAGISNIPGDQFNQNSIFLENDPSNRISCAELRVDFDALNLLGIDLQVGRWFDKSMQQDSAGMRFIVNVATIKALGLEDPIGTKLVWDEEAGFRKGNIIGVIEDFHFKSMHESVQPMIINVNPGSLSYLMVKINSQNMSQVLDQLETVHANFDQQFDFDYSFLDQKIGKLYDAERKALNVFNLFTMIALLLSSIGLIGLAYLIISQRTREIGIRKVMGARVLDILWMENKSFLKIMVLALIVGLPISFLVMERWTDAFAYQAPFSSIPFLWTMVVIASVVISSVSLAVLRTVLRNPGDALRYE
jgi:putative ABC transport system permease protein